MGGGQCPIKELCSRPDRRELQVNQIADDVPGLLAWRTIDLLRRLLQERWAKVNGCSFNMCSRSPEHSCRSLQI